MAYDNYLELPNLPTHRGRINYINRNIFDNQDSIYNKDNDTDKSTSDMTFEKFYNIRSTIPRSDTDEQQIRSRWLGVKRVGSPYKDESMKMTLDFIAGYIVYCKEYSVKHDIHTFKLLKKRQAGITRQKELTEDELEELDRIEKNILAYRLFKGSSDKDDIVFYYNRPYENFLKRRVKTETDESVLKRLENQIKTCKHLRIQARQKNELILKKENKIKTLKNQSKRLYKQLKSNRNDESLLKTIVSKIKLTRKIERDIHGLEIDLGNITDNYMQITELQVNLR